MRMRALAVVALVCLAGCSGLFADPRGTDRATLTSAPVPTATEETDTRVLPPGVGGGGDLRLDALVAAHRAALTDRSYVWIERRATARTDGGDVEPRPIRSAHVADEDCYRFWSESYTVRSGMETRVAYNYTEYVTDGVGHTRLQTFRTGEWEHYRLPAPAASRRVGTATARAIRKYLHLPAANVTVSVGSPDGERRYVVEGRGSAPSGVGRASNYSVAAVVDGEGLVRSLSAEYRVPGVDGPRAVIYEFSLDPSDPVTVETPAWVDRAC